MAKIKLGELVMDISGSVRNHVFSKWNGRHYLRTNASYIGNPKTKVAEGKKKNVSELSKIYNNILTDTERAGWESYAKSLGSVRRGQSNKAEKVPGQLNSMLGTGHSAFMRTNINYMLLSYGHPIVPPIREAPQGFMPPTPPEKTGCTYDVGLGTITIDYKNPLSFGAWKALEAWEHAGNVQIWHQPPNKHARMIEPTFPVDYGEEGNVEQHIVSFYTDRDQQLDLTPGKHKFWLTFINVWGKESGPSAINTVVIPQPTKP